MVKSFAAFLIFASLGAAVIALPGFAPKVEASEVPLAKADRLTVRSSPANCAGKAWPDFERSCLQSRDSRDIVEVRLVTTRR